MFPFIKYEYISYKVFREKSVSKIKLHSCWNYLIKLKVTILKLLTENWNILVVLTLGSLFEQNVISCSSLGF